MLSNFIEDLKQSKFYNSIIDKHKVILMFISGSRIIGVTDERSDYDIIVVVDDNQEVSTQEYLIYNGVKVHWYYIPLAQFITANSRESLRCYGKVLFANIRDDVIIYSNPDYEDVTKLLLDNKNAIAANGANKTYRTYSNLIRSILEAGAILPQHHTKFLSHLCVVSLAITGEKLTDETRSLLRQLKRIRWQPVSDEAKAWCVVRLTLLNRIMKMGEVQHAYSIY